MLEVSIIPSFFISHLQGGEDVSRVLVVEFDVLISAFAVVRSSSLVVTPKPLVVEAGEIVVVFSWGSQIKL